MKKIILKREDDYVFVEDIDRDSKVSNLGIVATFVPDSSASNEIYFLVGNNPHKFYFANLYGQALGAKEYETAQEAIQKRLQGSDCCCERTEVYLFENIKEALEKLGG